MLIGIADLSFLASQDFIRMIEKIDDISFGVYSPLEWTIWQQRYAVFDEKKEKEVKIIKNFIEKRFSYSDNINYKHLAENIRYGFTKGSLLPIRTDFTKPYKNFNPILNEYEFRKIAYRDLSNILLAGKLGLPLWIENGSELWLEEIYKIKTIDESVEVSLPLYSGNPKSKVKEYLSDVINDINKKVLNKNIKENFQKKVSETLEVPYTIKKIILDNAEPLPLWEGLPPHIRLLASGILLIIDAGYKLIK